MTLLVFGLVAGAAVLHATWNVLLKTAGDPLRTSARSMAIGTCVAIPVAAGCWVAFGRPEIPPEAVALAVLSGIAEVSYFILLSAAYRKGDLSLVYPIARGSAPLLAVVAGVVLLGERLGPVGAAGVAALLAGILAVRRPWTALRPAPGDDEAATRLRRQAVLLALGTGVATAAYSAIDRVGARLLVPWLYVVLLWAFGAGGLWLAVRVADSALAGRTGGGGAGASARPSEASQPAESAGLVLTPDGIATAPVSSASATSRAPISSAALLSAVASGAPASTEPGPPRTPPAAADWPRAMAIGVMQLGAYFLVLVAYTLAPLTAVAPLRESAVIIASGWGLARLGEAGERREAAWRIAGATLIVVGVLLLALDA